MRRRCKTCGRFVPASPIYVTEGPAFWPEIGLCSIHGFSEVTGATYTPPAWEAPQDVALFDEEVSES